MRRAAKSLVVLSSSAVVECNDEAVKKVDTCRLIAHLMHNEKRQYCQFHQTTDALLLPT